MINGDKQNLTQVAKSAAVGRRDRVSMEKLLVTQIGRQGLRKEGQGDVLDLDHHKISFFPVSHQLSSSSYV